MNKMKASDFSTEIYVDKPQRIDDQSVAVLVGVPFGYELDQVKLFPQCSIASEDGGLHVTHTGRGYRLRFRKADGEKIFLESAVDGSLIEVTLDE